MTGQKRMQAEWRVRDEFLCKLTSTLSGSVREVERLARAQPAQGHELEANLARLQAMLGELRIIANPDTPVPIRPRRIELCSVLERFFAERTDHFAKHRLRWTMEREGSIACRLDEAHFASMLDELLSNALKYRRGRAVTVDMTTAGAAVAIAVTNHGSWIGPKPTFARFQRGDMRRNVNGFGIGLWLTRRLAEAHGGALSIETTRAQTRAIISLPCPARRRPRPSFSARLTRK